jgi:D-alanyl-D-alanine carboxypeptidase (penicillin-binding protein 5/6)
LQRFFTFVLLFCSFSSLRGSNPIKCEVGAESAIMVNADSGIVLFEKNPDRQGFPASITKIATAIYALEKKSDNLDESVTAEQEAVASISPSAKRKGNYKSPSYWIETGATHIGIKRGESMPFNDLLHALLVSSANDAANVVAQHVGEGSIDNFMKGLNSYIKSLGCKDTQFFNPHGLHHPEHKTTVRDMAIIAQTALKNQIFKNIVSTKSYIIAKTNKQPSRTIVQTNQLLKKSAYTYDNAIGIKTGYTSDAGHTLVAAAKKDGRTLIAVVMNCSERKEAYKDVTRLFDTAFTETMQKQRVLNKGGQKYKLPLEGASTPLQTFLAEDLEYNYYPSEYEPVSVEIEWNSNLAVPISANSEVGIAKLMVNNSHIIASKPLYALKEVKPTLWYSIKSKYKVFAKNSFALKSILVSVFLLTTLIFLLRGRKRKRQES